MKNNVIADKRKGTYYLTYLLSECRCQPSCGWHSYLSLYHIRVNRQMESEVINKMQSLLPCDETHRNVKGVILEKEVGRGQCALKSSIFLCRTSGLAVIPPTRTSLCFLSWSFPGNHFPHLSSVGNLTSTEKKESDLM